MPTRAIHLMQMVACDTSSHLREASCGEIADKPIVTINAAPSYLLLSRSPMTVERVPQPHNARPFA